MATKITTTSELNVTLSSSDDQYKRVVKVSNPVDGLTFAAIQEAFEPAFAEGATSDTTISFFLDDDDDHTPMTKVLMAERVDIEREIRRFDSAHPSG